MVFPQQNLEAQIKKDIAENESLDQRRIKNEEEVCEKNRLLSEQKAVSNAGKMLCGY